MFILTYKCGEVGMKQAIIFRVIWPTGDFLFAGTEICFVVSNMKKAEMEKWKIKS